MAFGARRVFDEIDDARVERDGLEARETPRRDRNALRFGDLL